MKETGKNDPPRYSVSMYTFPTVARIAKVTFTDTHMVFDLEDGRYFGVPLNWFPTLAHAAPEDRQKFHLGDERNTIHWNPDEANINEDLRLSDYMKVTARTSEADLLDRVRQHNPAMLAIISAVVTEPKLRKVVAELVATFPADQQDHAREAIWSAVGEAITGTNHHLQSAGTL